MYLLEPWLLNTVQSWVINELIIGKCDVLAQNPYNAVMHLGHSNGTVTLWSPSMSSPLVKILCHKGPVQALAIDNSGKYMATAGLDGQLKLWDIRTYKELNAYFTTSPASSLKFSAKGLLAVGSGPRLTIWKDSYKMKQTEPYMTHLFPGSSIQDLEFCPYEDILGCGHASGISSLVIPGRFIINIQGLESQTLIHLKPTLTKQSSNVKNLKCTLYWIRFSLK